MTPEKARLMKAMKMREKKMKINASTTGDSDPSSAVHNNNDSTREEEADTSISQESKISPSAAAEGEDHSSSIPPSDSGISVDPLTPMSINTDTRSYGTTSESHPPSPTAASMSEIGDSTKASSLSESTDETVQPNKEISVSGHSEDDEDKSHDAVNTHDKAHENAHDKAHENAQETAHDKEEPLEMVAEDEAADLNELRPVETDEHAPKVTPEDPHAITLKEAVSEDATSTAISHTSHISQESQQISGTHTSSLLPTEPSKPPRDSDADAEDLTSKHPTKLNTTDLDTSLADQDDSPKSVLGVPRSKFSTSEPKSATSSLSSRSPTFPVSKLRSKFSAQDDDDDDDDDDDASGTLPSQPSIPTSIVVHRISGESRTVKVENRVDTRLWQIPENQESVVVPLKSSGRKSAESVNTGLAAKKTPQSEVSDPLLDDDALMDELQSAEVQEARPMLVSKSPITPVFPGSTSDANTNSNNNLVRTVSNPIRGPLLVPSDVTQSSARSVSAGGAVLLHNITRQPSSAGLQSKKGGVGSSISQRIKALEKLSGKPEPAGDGRPKTAAPTSSFYTIRKGNNRQKSGADDDGSLEDESGDTAPGNPEKHTHTRARSGSMANRLTMFGGYGGFNVLNNRPDSIQVTARILRDPTQATSTQLDARRDPGDFGPVELKESPLIVDVRNSGSELQLKTDKVPAVDAQGETVQESPSSEEGGKKSRRPSMSVVKDYIKERRASVMSRSTDNLASPNRSSTRPASASSNKGRRMSTSSRRSLSYDDRENRGNMTPLRSPSAMSDASGDEGSDKKSGKSRASRFMRRLSNSLTPNRKNGSANISPTLVEESADEAAAAPKAPAAPEAQSSMSAYMGDVNVQFPNHLLWKRRNMCLDSNGWLILSAVQGAAIAAGIKRYHMSEFCAPYTPDVDVEELPHSVRLDLTEGSCLQIACEDRAGQMNALRGKLY